MRIERCRQIEHLGAVRIHGVRRVLELDSGTQSPAVLKESVEAQKIEREAISAIQQKLAIVLPVKDEDIKIFEGVLSGIPHDCLMIVVSNSQREEIDNFRNEQEALSRFCYQTARNGLIVHQKDPFLAEALASCGYTDILDENGLVRSGKSEGMILGILLALLQDKEYVGFIDTDNYIPGAVWEYAQHYAIGFYLAPSPYAMVRILWKYKPKISGELYFRRWGRVSEITNKQLNHLLSTKGKFETDIIRTGNAGEHAMSLQLARKLRYATGYGVETQEFMSIFELFSGLLPIADKTVAEKGVDIIQTETINPHIHEERGEEHLIQDMLLPSLSVIYRNQLCDNTTREAIKKQLVELNCIKSDDDIPDLRMLPPLESIDIKMFSDVLESHLADYAANKGWPMGVKLPVSSIKGKEIKRIFFTDLDGTLLHPVSYSYAAALDSLQRLQETGIPIVFCSAKTMAEQEVYRQELKITDPFIIENGAAVVIPRDYFRFPFSFSKIMGNYFIIELGISYEEVRLKLKPLREEFKTDVIFFGDLSTEQVSKATGLNLLMAGHAKQRVYSETLIIEGNKKQEEAILKAVKDTGLNYTFGGKFYEVYQGGDKGKATKILIELFKLNYGDIYTVGIGDSTNDADMLSSVDLPILVQAGIYRWNKLHIKNLRRVKGVGPVGWSRAVSLSLA